MNDKASREPLIPAERMSVMRTVLKRTAAYRLYSAMREQADKVAADHGTTLPQMWAIVQGDSDFGQWWRLGCLKDFEGEG